MSNHYQSRATTVEVELNEYLADANFNLRQGRAVAARLGWDGTGTKTLAEAAAPEGYSRERVRQLENLLRARLSGAERPLRATRGSLRLLEALAPLPSAEAAQRLGDAGLTQHPFAPSGLLTAADLLGLRHALAEQGSVLTLRGHAGVLDSVHDAARKAVTRDGAANVHALPIRNAAGVETSTLEALLSCHADIEWIEGSCNWFTLRGVRSRAAMTLRKMLSIRSSLRLTDVREGLCRAHGVTFPAEVILAICEAQPWLAVDRSGEMVHARTMVDREHVLSPLEQMLVAMFLRRGPTLRFMRIRDLALRQDIPPGTIAGVLRRTAVIRNLERGRYELCGAAA